MLRIVLPIAVVATALLAPMSAHATLLGMESNRELVNTTQTAEDQAEALQKMKDQGVQVVRANWRWYEVAGACGGQSAKQLQNHKNPCYDWSRLDNLVKGANSRRMQVLLSLTQNPSWVLPNAPKYSYSDTQYFMGNSSRDFNRMVSHYSAFYKAAASRYRPGTGYGVVKYWTVHNEPNSRFYWGYKPNPARYAQLYARTAVAVKQGWGGAKVAPGPTGPTGGSGGMKPMPFIRTFQRSVVRYLPGSMARKRTYISAWAHNPYPAYNNQPSFSLRSQHRDSITMGTIDKLSKQLDSQPITKRTKIWATEFGWETAPERQYAVSAARQAQYIAEAFDWLDSRRVGRQGRVEIGVNYGLSDPEDVLNDWQSGTYTNDGRPKKSVAMLQRMISVPQAGNSGRVRANTKLRIWGRSNVNPGGTVISWRVVGGTCKMGVARNAYCKVEGQRSVIGTPGAKYGYVTIKRGQRLEFKTYDAVAKEYGPSRVVTAR